MNLDIYLSEAVDYNKSNQIQRRKIALSVSIDRSSSLISL
jgi:hypothetical protein